MQGPDALNTIPLEVETMLVRKLTKFLSFILVFSLALSITACNSSKPESAVPAPNEKATLVFWHPNSFGDEEIKDEKEKRMEFFKKFQEENNATINEVNQPDENYQELLKAANMAHNGPDLFLSWAGAPTTDYSDYLVPLNKYLKDEDYKDHFGWELARKDFGQTGDVYGIPYLAYNQNCVYYNKPLFAKAGIAESSLPPRTMEDLYKLCEQLKAKGIVPFVVGAKDGFIAQWAAGAFLGTMVGSDYGEMLKPDFKFAGSPFEKALDIWATLGRKGYINKDALSISANDEMRNKFIAGSGAMMYGGDWEAARIYDSLKDDVGVFMLPPADPGSPNGDYLYVGPGQNFCITNYSKNPDLSFKFIQLLNSREFNLMRLNTTSGAGIPNDTRITEEDIAKSNLCPLIKTIINATSKSRKVVIFDLWPTNVQSECWRLGGPLTVGKISGKEVCAAMDKEMAKSSR